MATSAENNKNDEILRKTRMHDMARQIVNETVTGKLSLDTSEKIAALTLPPLKQAWVRDQVTGILTAEK